uniref:Zinc finger and BTB domain containing 7C n=1 Tax=Canis lupus familiaris TaxID=9615 RepID=A0A8P0TS85_CANLF
MFSFLFCIQRGAGLLSPPVTHLYRAVLSFGADLGLLRPRCPIFLVLMTLLGCVSMKVVTLDDSYHQALSSLSKKTRALAENMANGIDELIGIPFPNHSSEVLCSLNEQRHDGLLCDVLLVVQEQEYRTHRSVLAACSKYFKKLFTAGALASQPYVYEIDFVQPEALAAILDFAYTSTLTITASNVKHILNAARMLEIQCIVNVCLEIMEPGGDGGEEDDKEDDDDEDEDEDEEDEEEEEEEEEDEEDEEDDTEDFADQENLTDPQDINCHQSPSKTDHLTEKAYSDTPRDFPDSFQAGSPSHLGVIRDFSIESLLRENLYPKANIADRRPSLSPFAPDFFPHLWPGDFGAFTQLPEQPMDSGPLDLVIKNRKIKEEEKEELPPPPPPPFPSDFFKDMFPDLPGGPLGPIKAESDYGAYLNFLSATHLGGLFPPWPLVEERKLKPKASQQCPICHKVIMGAGKLPRHMRTHTGEKPYMCNICEVRFTRCVSRGGQGRVRGLDEDSRVGQGALGWRHPVQGRPSWVLGDACQV